jgi:hypothetical protein
MKTLVLLASAIAIVGATPAIAKTHHRDHATYTAQPRARLQVNPQGYDAYSAYGAYTTPYWGSTDRDPDPRINDYLHFDPPSNRD